jgi:DNA polymerase-3 subunit delta'
MALRDIIGQDRALNILIKTIQRDRIPSAYLFAGESGIGKKFTAINLAKALNCLTPPRGGGMGGGDSELRTQLDACDECPSCKKIDSGFHPDFMLIVPESGQIRIEEIRAIDEILSLKAFEGRYKIVIVDDAEMMNQYAANAFLKTIEEPPPDSLIILITSSPDLLPETIRSRCSRINFTPLSHEACKKVMETVISQRSDIAVQQHTLTLLVNLSMGRPGIAITGDLIEERAWFMKVLMELLNAERDGWTSKEEMARWFEYLLIMLRDMAVLKITDDETRLINSDDNNFLRKLSNELELKSIIEHYFVFYTLKGYFNFHLNKSLTWNYTGSLLRRITDLRYA